MGKKWLCIFDGLERDYEQFWLSYIKYKDWEGSNPKVAEEKERIWNKIVRWVDEYCRLYRSVVPEPHTSCLVETLQQYRDYSQEDMLHTIKTLGELANWLYLSYTDIFQGSRLHDNHNELMKYYTMALDQVVWIVASFVNKGKCEFVSLYEILLAMMREKK